VCHANHCRSPLIEHLLRQALARDTNPGWTITSAGTHARPGLPCHPAIARILRKRGIDPGNWSSSTLDIEKINAADLILTSGLEQRRQVVNMSFAAVGRTFPLLAFAAWLDHDVEKRRQPRSSAELLASALRGQARTQPLTPAEQNLRDPIGHGYRHFRQCARTVDKAIASIKSAAASSLTTRNSRP
jgi:protein-tyrosine phosphatase